MKTATTTHIKADCGCEYYEESWYNVKGEKEWTDRLYIGYCDKHLPSEDEE